MWKLVGLGAFVLVWSRSVAAGPLDQPAFTATPAQLLAEAKQRAASDAPVVYLRDDTTITYDDAGRAQRRYHMVFVIQSAAAIDTWGTFATGWRPFYQDRPVIRARVIGPTGTVAELDPSLVSDAPSVSESPSVYSDRRDMRAPRPRLAVGAVVEEELVVQDREPLLPAGVTDFIGLERTVPIARQVVTISAPSARKLHVVARGFDRAPTPKRTTAGGRTTWVYDIGAIAADLYDDVSLPSDLPSGPYIGIGTAASWAAVATDYQRLVDARLRDPVTLPPELAPGTDRATVDRIVAWLHAHVRYTGIELSDSAIIPWPPAETLKRGFGDCKDKATLLIALLRAAGISAELVLLSTGPGLDVDRALPGMGSFDHAIVRARVGGKDVWIDATEDSLPAGQLPARDQGRRALIIAAGTRDLVMTPVAAAADNAVREVRTYKLSELTYASVTEVTREHGVFGDNLRRWIGDTAATDARKSLTTYVAREYIGKLASFTSTAPHDIGTPFAVTLEVTDSRRAIAARGQIDVYVFPSDVLERLPPIFTSTDAEVEADLKARTADYQWHVPFVHEIEHRLIVPPGHAMPALVASERRALGAMTLAITRRIDGDTAVVTYRLDTGKRRITAAELRATRAAVVTAQAANGEHLLFAEIGATLRQQGKLAEAIAECQRVIALHPKEAIHYSQLAAAYRDAGMGAAALRAARKGVEVEPTSSDGHAVLAFQLQHDAMGRQGAVGSDRKGAIAAYREALRLDPSHLGATYDLATILARDDRGRPSGDRAVLREAATLMRRAHDLAADGSYQADLLYALLRAEQYAEAEAFAAPLPDSEARSVALVSAATFLRGWAAARPLVTGSNRSAVLRGVLAHTFLARRYDLAREVHAEMVGRVDPQFASVERYDPSKLDRAAPETAVAMLVDNLTGTPIDRPWGAEVAADLAIMAADARAASDQALVTLPFLVTRDFTHAAMALHVTGNARDGWRVTSDVHAGVSFYVVLRGKRAEVIGATDLRSGLAATITAAIAKGDLTTATRWVDRIATDAAASQDGWATALTDLVRVETAKVGGKPLPKPVLELAAALLGGRSHAAIAAPPLRTCVSERDALRDTCRQLLLEALEELRQWPEAAELGGTLAAAAPSDRGRGYGHAMLLARAGKRAEANAIVDGFLARNPDDVEALRARMMIALEHGTWAEAQPWVDRLAAHASATSGDLNNIAWLHLFHDGTPATARALALRAETKAGSDVSSNLSNTLAAVMAESDEPYRAWQYLRRSMPAALAQPPGDADWYVAARIAESYGLRDDAIAGYRRIKRPPSDFLPTAFGLAQRNLARLGVKAP